MVHTILERVGSQIVPLAATQFRGFTFGLNGMVCVNVQQHVLKCVEQAVCVVQLYMA